MDKFKKLERGQNPKYLINYMGYVINDEFEQNNKTSIKLRELTIYNTSNHYKKKQETLKSKDLYKRMHNVKV